MGAWMSRQWEELSEEAAEVATAGPAATSTPTQAAKGRVLDEDPRSPTTSINRTPIEVNSTPGGTDKRTLRHPPLGASTPEDSPSASPTAKLILKPKLEKSLHKRMLEKRLQDKENDTPLA